MCLKVSEVPDSHWNLQTHRNCLREEWNKSQQDLLAMNHKQITYLWRKVSQLSLSLWRTQILLDKELQIQVIPSEDTPHTQSPMLPPLNSSKHPFGVGLVFVRCTVHLHAAGSNSPSECLLGNWAVCWERKRKFSSPQKNSFPELKVNLKHHSE